MKRRILLSFFAATMLLGTTHAANPSIELQPFAGYAFQSTVYGYDGSATIDDGLTYGGTLSVVLNKRASIDLTYSREDVSAYAETYYYGPLISKRTDFASNYILIGGTKLFPVGSGQTSLYGGLGIGAAIYNWEDGSTTRFAGGAKLGVKSMFSERIGIFAQGTANFPMIFSGTSLWWSPGSGTSVAVSSVVPFWQFGLSGGLVIQLN